MCSKSIGILSFFNCLMPSAIKINPEFGWKECFKNTCFIVFSSHSFHLSPAEIDPRFISFLFRNLPNSGFHRSASNRILFAHLSGAFLVNLLSPPCRNTQKTTTVPRHQSVHEDHVPHPKIYLPWWGPGWNNSKTKSKLVIMRYDQIWGGVPVWIFQGECRLLNLQSGLQFTEDLRNYAAQHLPSFMKFH